MKKVLILRVENKKILDSMLNLESVQLCLSGGLSAANVRILFAILQNFLCISYGAGVRTLSRYTEYSERTQYFH